MRTFLRILLLLTTLTRVAFADSITVSAAISLKESLTQIAADYQAKSGDTVALNFGASGQLSAQIAQGAPVDVFISAGVKEMDQLAAANLIDTYTRRNICGNGLVLIVPADAKFVPASFSDLTDSRILKIAIGQPKSVPAGQYAQDVFTNLKLTDAVTPKLVLGENVRQVLDYVIRGEVEAGIVYSTDALSAGEKVKVAAIAPESSHKPIVYPAAIIKATSKADAARRFLDYLSSDAAVKVFTAHGFTSLPTLHVRGTALQNSDWSVAQLQQQLATEIKPIDYNSRGAKHTFDCVPLLAVLKAAGGQTDFTMQPGANHKVKNPQMRQVVVVTGRDGYTVLFSLGELLPMVGNRAVWVALDEDGQSLPDADGPVRLIVPDDKMPSRAVHEVDSIALVDIGTPATQTANP